MKIEIFKADKEMRTKAGVVKCAFDRNRSCFTTCAACVVRGQRIFCTRNSVDNEFEIGYTD